MVGAMVNFVTSVPPSAFACGAGELEAVAPTAVTAGIAAQMDATAAIVEQVSRAVMVALDKEPDLLESVASMKKQRYLYTITGRPVAVPGRAQTWRLPFRAYVLEG